MKWVALASLTVQTSAQVYVIKWARREGNDYLPTTIVLFTEILKASVSFLLVSAQAGGVLAGLGIIHQQLFQNPREALKALVPSLLYTVQNNMMFFSLAMLSAAVQQVTYQLKIFTTAILSVLMLGKTLDPVRWVSLVFLVVGVMLVQWPKPNGETISNGSRDEGFFGIERGAALGFAAVLAACFTSGFASVYLEKLLKHTTATIWERNVQLGIFGAIMAFAVAMWQDGERIMAHGLTQGYSFRVVCVILNNALGGLLCAAVLKYADNILRCFSTALSIILTCMLSAWGLQEFEPDGMFVLGSSFAILATFSYNIGPQFVKSWNNGSKVGVEKAAENGVANGHSKAPESLIETTDARKTE